MSAQTQAGPGTTITKFFSTWGTLSTDSAQNDKQVAKLQEDIETALGTNKLLWCNTAATDGIVIMTIAYEEVVE